MKSLLTVVTPATSYDLTVLDRVKLELGVGNSERDEELTAWIHEASGLIASVCKRVFAEEVLSEVFRPEYSDYNTRSLVLSRRPVSSVSSIVEDTITLETTEYEIDYKAGIIYRLWSTDGLNRCYWSFCNKVTVTYTAGWFLLDDLPYDIERGCLNLIKWMNTNSLSSGGRGGDGNLKVLEIPGVIRREWGVGMNGTNNSRTIPYLPPEVMSCIGPYIENVMR